MLEIVFALLLVPWRAPAAQNSRTAQEIWLVHHSRETCALHEVGPVVRTGPNELSFNSAQSWRDIYDFRQGHKTFVKSDFYEGGSFADQCGSIVSERDPVAHGKMRRDLSHAFSQKSLSEQEFIIAGVTDRFIEKLQEQDSQEIDAVKWFTMLTFDIIGDLAFGETFNGIETGTNLRVDFCAAHTG